ncbi:MAG: RNA polymerase sigma factor [Actinomycetota bacterium]
MSPEEFNAAYREYLPQISKYLIRRCEREEVEELASRIFEIAWQKRNQAEVGFELPWLYRIAGFVVANHRRSQASKKSFLDSFRIQDSSPSAESIAIADLALGEAWARLNPAERQAISLVSFDGLTNQQAAKVLEISPNAFGIRLSRARNQLRELLSVDS